MMIRPTLERRKVEEMVGRNLKARASIPLNAVMCVR
jgi:hypothetical protein